MENLRKRTPFRSSDEDGVDGPILDDQEQEEVVEELRRQSVSSHDELLLFILRSMVLIIATLHLIFFINPNPLIPMFLPTTDTLLPPARLWMLLQLFVSLNITLNLFPEQSYPDQLRAFLARVPTLPTTSQVSIGVSAIVPIISIVFQRSWQQFVCWAAPTMIGTLVWLRDKWNKEATKEIEELEKLKYVARGA